MLIQLADTLYTDTTNCIQSRHTLDILHETHTLEPDAQSTTLCMQSRHTLHYTLHAEQTHLEPDAQSTTHCMQSRHAVHYTTHRIQM